LRRYPVAAIACCTRSRVSAFTARVPLSTWETVDMDTAATLATSDIVTIVASSRGRSTVENPPADSRRRGYSIYRQALAQALVCPLRCRKPEEFGRGSPHERNVRSQLSTRDRGRSACRWSCARGGSVR